MKALRFDRYGSAAVLEVAEVPEPECRAGAFKVRVHAAGLNPLDWKIRAGHLALVPGFERPPRGVGIEFAGVIVGVGGGATSHFVGQRVFGALPPTGRQGSLAEFVVASGDHLAAIPDGVDFARSLGADVVVDYTREDFLRSNATFDVVFDAACSSGFAACRRVLAPGGIYLSTSGNMGAALRTMAAGLFARVATNQRAVALMLEPRAPMWQRLARHAAAGVLRPHIARRIGLAEVAAAQTAMESGHGRGKIVVIPA